MAILAVRRATNPSDYVLVSGPDPSAATKQIDPVRPPSPNLETMIDKVNLPAALAENNFVKEATTETFKASVDTTVPCKKGTYSKRFYIVPKASAGKQGLTPGKDTLMPAAYVVVLIDIVENGTTLKINEFKTFLLEFVPNYDFTHGTFPRGALDELPKIKHKGEIPGETRNIVKLIEEDGKKVDNPFEPKAR